MPVKTRHDAEKLLDYFCANPRPLSVAQLAAAGIMTSQEASNALRYALRVGLVQRVRQPNHPAPHERVQYRLNDRNAPPASKSKRAGAPSFDGLLTAWGIARVPPRLATTLSARNVETEWNGADQSADAPVDE